MLTQEVIEKLRQNMDADGLFTVPASETDPDPEIIMPKGLTWEEKRKWALDTFDQCLARTQDARRKLLDSLEKK